MRRNFVKVVKTVYAGNTRTVHDGLGTVEIHLGEAQDDDVVDVVGAAVALTGIFGGPEVSGLLLGVGTETVGETYIRCLIKAKERRCGDGIAVSFRIEQIGDIFPGAVGSVGNLAVDVTDER